MHHASPPVRGTAADEGIAQGDVRRKALRSITALVMALMFLSSEVQAESMNVVLILIDDMGWSDLSCFGSD